MNHVRYREADRTGEESFMKYDLEHYRQYLIECEKSKNTIEKYLRDVRNFLIFSGGRELSKEIILEYKKLLVEKYLINPHKKIKTTHQGNVIYVILQQ